MPERPASILVVDDEKITRMNLDHVLTKEGYAVTTAADGVEAMAVLEEAGHELDPEGFRSATTVPLRSPRGLGVDLHARGDGQQQEARLGDQDRAADQRDDDVVVQTRVQRLGEPCGDRRGEALVGAAPATRERRPRRLLVGGAVLAQRDVESSCHFLLGGDRGVVGLHRLGVERARVVGGADLCAEDTVIVPGWVVVLEVCHTPGCPEIVHSDIIL